MSPIFQNANISRNVEQLLVKFSQMQLGSPRRPGLLLLKLAQKHVKDSFQESLYEFRQILFLNNPRMKLFQFLAIDHPEWPPSVNTKNSKKYETDVMNDQMDFD